MATSNRKGTGKIRSPGKMKELWEEFKVKCDHETVVNTAFSPSLGEFVTSENRHPITYTLKGFCNFVGMTEQNFNATYQKDPKFESVIACMKEECEIDARKKFENGTLDSRLAALWMYNYGYSTKTDTNVKADVEVVIVDDIENG